MSSTPESQGESSARDRLPFEPGKNRKATGNDPVESKPVKKTVATKAKESKAGSRSQESSAIPDIVSRRMVKRMALFSGIPTAFGMSTFVASYLLVSKDIVELPNVAVVLVSMGFFGLGVLGLTYGVLSASWDEEVSGSAVGWSEFTTNLGRMTEAWRANKKS